jgi:hypothetical protein
LSSSPITLFIICFVGHSAQPIVCFISHEWCRSEPFSSSSITPVVDGIVVVPHSFSFFFSGYHHWGVFVPLFSVYRFFCREPPLVCRTDFLFRVYSVLLHFHSFICYLVLYPLIVLELEIDGLKIDEFDRPLMGLNRGWRQWVPKSLALGAYFYISMCYLWGLFSPFICLHP